MQKTTKARIREAAEWPSARELAEQYNVSHRYIRQLIERGQLETVRLNVIRVNPASFEAYIEAQNEPQ
jgi:excisionase family DNA binding protein